jgi:hypothetical protein
MELAQHIVYTKLHHFSRANKLVRFHSCIKIFLMKQLPQTSVKNFYELLTKFAGFSVGTIITLSLKIL